MEKETMTKEAKAFLLPGERIDDLQRKGLRIIQSKEQFSFSTDAVVLAHFAAVKHHDRVLEVGTGNGVISLLTYSRYEPKEILALEIQKVLADRAKRNVELNGLTEKIQVMEGDMREYKTLFSAQSFDAVICNPPYRPVGHGEQNEKDHYAIAKHEICLTLKELVRGAQYVLKDKGRFYLVHRTDRIGEILSALRDNRLEPKTIRFVYSKPGVNSHLVLLEARKDGKPDCKVLPPLYLYEEAGKVSAEIRRIYEET